MQPEFENIVNLPELVFDLAFFFGLGSGLYGFPSKVCGPDKPGKQMIARNQWAFSLIGTIIKSFSNKLIRLVQFLTR